ncbi:hypothetical protein Tco_1511138, partial [Tanacetum coccineum]
MFYCPKLFIVAEKNRSMIAGSGILVAVKLYLWVQLDISGAFRKGVLPGILSLSTKFLPTVTNLLRKLAKEWKRPTSSDVHRNTSSPPKASRVIHDSESNSGLSSIASSE